MPDAAHHGHALPVAVIGAGPVGLAAAAHLVSRGRRPLLVEAGPGPGHAVGLWGHVRMFSQWKFNTDPAARALLEATGWEVPDPDTYPTGADLIARYVAPLASALVRAGAELRFGARVVAVSRRHYDRLHDGNRAVGLGREASPFVLHVAAVDGEIAEVEAAAVIDASGTWNTPNPAGAHGLPAPGEAANSGRITYGIPDVLSTARGAYAGATTLVLGGGHSAMNAVIDLITLAREEPGTRVLWAFRRPLAAVNFGGGAADGLAARGTLGANARALVEAGQVEALAPFLVHRIEAVGDGLVVHAERDGRTEARRIDRMIVATGFRPDLSFLSELRLGLDPAVQTTPALAPLIDPNLHSCGTVRPHGEAELRHPDEPGFYMAGMKSYGRAPTFLLATGHEQVRSIAAFLAGDVAAARRVELVLPETGVCSTDRPASAIEHAVPAPATAAGCCGPCRTPEPAIAPTVQAPERMGSCCAPTATA